MKRVIVATVIGASLISGALAGNMFFFGVGSSGGGSVTACGAGQLDFQDACGTTQYMVILR